MKSLLLILATVGLFACSSMPQQRTAASLPSQEDESANLSLATSPPKKTDLLKYYMNIAKMPKVTVADQSHRRYCDNDPNSSCISNVCDRGSFRCQFESDLNKVAELCRGVKDGRCITEVCNQGGFSCQFQSDLEKVIGLCHESVGPCIKSVCGQGGFSCQFESDVTKVAKLCENVDPRCVDDLCSRGAYSCRFESDLTKVIKLCKNQ